MTASRGLRPAVAHQVQMVAPCDPGHTSPAERRALRQFLADLPDPRETALALPGPLLEALVTTVRNPEGRRVTHLHQLPGLRRHGLADIRAPYLTNFGNAVRRAAMEG